MSDTEAAAGAGEEVPVVYLHEVSRRYRQGESTLTILNGAKLALWAGQSVALVAPSGAGKSTLLHIAGLLEHPDEGEVYMKGTATTALTDLQRTLMRRDDVGFVYQSHRLLPEFSALENVMMPQLVRGLSRTEAHPPRRGNPRLSRTEGTRRRIVRPNCPAASSSGSPSPARSPMRRASCSPTSRPATSIRTPPTMSSMR